MDTAKENYIQLESINITISKQTLQICAINSDTQLYTGLNIFDFFKSFQPVFNEYPDLNAFLTQLKMYQRNRISFTTNIVSNFHNNFNFYNKISNNSSICNYVKQFTITLIPNDNMATVCTGLAKPCNATSKVSLSNLSFRSGKEDVYDDLRLGGTASILISAYGMPYNNPYDKLPVQKHYAVPSIYQFEFNTEQLKHEISNSLNLINMSNILINNSFKNPELEKYTNIISNELQNTANILNCSNNTQHSKELITVKEFYNYINSFLDKINIIYNINDDGLINFESLTTDILDYSYLNINTSWFKIILDNIFKNIYGHIGDTYSLLLKVFNVYYNQELNMICIDIINKKIDSMQNNIARCNLYKQITDKYDLSQLPNMTSIKRNNSQGLKLINILCEKQNIDWQLLELSDNEYIFKLSIPVYSKYKTQSCNLTNIPLTLNSKPISTHDESRDRRIGVTPVADEFTFGAGDSMPVQSVYKKKDSALKISNIYLNDANRETVI